MLFFSDQRRVKVIPQPAGEAAIDPAYETRLQEAYDRGRRYERALHTTSPLVHTLTGAAAVIGLAVSVLAFHEHSFARAGQIMDADFAKARVEAQPLAREAAFLSGRLAQLSGRLLQSQGRAVEHTGQKMQSQDGDPQRS